MKSSRHPVQRSILEKLRTTAKLRYTDMRPSHIENDLYNYHLQQLVKHRLIIKEREAYRLSHQGKRHLLDLNPLTAGGASHHFKVAALCLLLRGSGEDTQVLYQRRARQPFAGQHEIIGGGVKRGEPVVQAARRRLQEEAGLSATFTSFGLIRKLRFDTRNQLYGDILYHLCASNDYSGSLVEQSSYGHHAWLSLDDAAHIESSSLTGSQHLSLILPQLKTTPYRRIPFFYAEETYQHDIS